MEQEFIQAVREGDLMTIHAMLADRPELANARDEHGVSALLLAIYHGRLPVAEVIADAKGELDVFEAAALGRDQALAQIVERDPSARDAFSPDGFTPLGLAAYFGSEGAVRRLLALGADPGVVSHNALEVMPLHSALAGGHRDVARVLIEAGSPVNTDGAGGWTPLHYAAHNGDVEITRLLLARGAPRDAQRGDGQTPAAVARERAYPEVVALLEG